MNGQAMIGNGGQPAAGETPMGQELIDAAMQACLLLIQESRATQSAQEAKDFSAAVLNYTQVIALMDPTRDDKGVPLGHHMDMQKLAGEQELEKVKEQSKAQAQAPRKTVTSRRSKDGSTVHEVNG